MTDLQLQFANDGAEFTKAIIRQLLKSHGKENIFVSPFSIRTCMGMVYAGAGGGTASEIAQGMRYTNDSVTEVGESTNAVLEQYKDSDILKVANKVYVNKDSRLKSDYKDTIAKHYDTTAEAMDFSQSSEAAKTINQWVDTKTCGKISEIVTPQSLDASTKIILLNALHFKGEWQQRFNEARTEVDDFFVEPDVAQPIEFMQVKSHYGMRYFVEFQCCAFEMPYKDSGLSMFILMPMEGSTIAQVLEELQNADIIKNFNFLPHGEVEVKFPKFKMDFHMDLKTVLQEMNITTAFSSAADFSHMLEPSNGVCLSQVIHKTCIEVNEAGTVAAAVTKSRIQRRSAIKKNEFIANRPFIYWIWDKKTILFAGTFVKPPKMN